MTPAPRLTSVLHRGDNLAVLPDMPDESVDLIYLDPPFFSNRNYEVVFGDESEIRSFEDRWAGGILHYIEWMRPRLEQLERVLKPTGSLYLHSDWHAVHFLRQLADSVFGERQFQNEVIWYYRGAGVSPRRWGRRHDNLLFYTKGKTWTFNVDPVRDEYAPATQERFKHYIGNVRKGGDFGPQSLNPKGKHPDDVWEISIVAPSASERLGYPTQKPPKLLERIILASSNAGDVVLDPFCGCGTALAEAERLGRQWIGIDIAPTAIKVTGGRLQEQGADFMVLGMPETVEQLLTMRPFEFQNWVINQIRGQQSPRKTADMGIDGYSAAGDPVQVKRSVRIGRGVVDTFQTAVVRAKKSRGYIVAGSFTKGAFEETARAKRETGIDIRLVPVGDLFEDQKMAGHGLIPARLFGDEAYVPKAVKEARPSPEQLIISEQTAAEPAEEAEIAEDELPLVSAEPLPRSEQRLKPVPDLVEDLLEHAGIDHPPVRLEPILEGLNMEMAARPGQKQDALLVPMTDPEQGPVAAWMVYYDPQKPEARRRFTLAHEIGHVMIHGKPYAAAARGGGGRFKAREREVERFAAELLMPERFVRAAVRQYGTNIDQLRALFLVSRRSMEIRLRELGLGQGL
jgi:DNA modification methylase